MAKARTDVQQQVADLLLIAKRSLGLSVSFLSRLDGTTQHLEVVESSVPFLFQEGNKQVQATSLCQAIIDKKLPAVIPDLKNFPEAMKLPAARLPGSAATSRCRCASATARSMARSARPG